MPGPRDIRDMIRDGDANVVLYGDRVITKKRKLSCIDSKCTLFLYCTISREWICIIKILYVYILFALKIERRFQKSNIVFLSPLQSTIYQQYLVLIQLKYF